MEQNKQQTAVEWLVSGFKEWCDAFPSHGNDIPEHIIQKAKAMEKEQIKTAYNKGYQDGEIDSLDAKDGDVEFFEDAEQYYNETYGKETN